MPTVAVIGAGIDRGAFANKAVRAHLANGWTVFPIHPRVTEVEGLPVYRSLEEVPIGSLDRVALYVRPQIVAELLPAISRRNVGELFFNPGTYTPSLLKEAELLGLPVRVGCSIVSERFSPADFAE